MNVTILNKKQPTNEQNRNELNEINDSKEESLLKDPKATAIAAEIINKTRQQEKFYEEMKKAGGGNSGISAEENIFGVEIADLY